MAGGNKLLALDGAINLVLGLALITFPSGLVAYLGVPESESHFYPNILGAVFVGIAIALFMESRPKDQSTRGLGLQGALIINLCGGLVLAAWLLFGELNLPLRGFIFLWGLVTLLAGISCIELIAASGTSREADQRS